MLNTDTYHVLCPLESIEEATRSFGEYLISEYVFLFYHLPSVLDFVDHVNGTKASIVMHEEEETLLRYYLSEGSCLGVKN